MHCILMSSSIVNQNKCSCQNWLCLNQGLQCIEHHCSAPTAAMAKPSSRLASSGPQPFTQTAVKLSRRYASGAMVCAVSCAMGCRAHLQIPLCPCSSGEARWRRRRRLFSTHRVAAHLSRALIGVVTWRCSAAEVTTAQVGMAGMQAAAWHWVCSSSCWRMNWPTTLLPCSANVKTSLKVSTDMFLSI